MVVAVHLNNLSNLNIDNKELMKYKVDRNAPLPTREPIEKLA